MESILVIDDSATIRQYLRSILEKNGYIVYESVDGKEGYNLFKELSPDFVITDIFMPEMDGIETIQKLRSHYPDAKIIAMSGGGKMFNIPYFELCRRFGVVNCLNKPISKDVLISAIKSFK